jgi:hypothetical protein
MRQILFTEPVSGLSARCDLLDDKAPKSTDFLWRLAQERQAFNAIHAIWTGPELSCPLPAHVLPATLSETTVPLENATSYPEVGDILLACVLAGTVKGLPPGNFYDVGLFYGPGARMLMPFGWIMGNVCARIIDQDLASAQSCIRAIQQNGACKLSIEPVE